MQLGLFISSLLIPFSSISLVAQSTDSIHVQHIKEIEVVASGKPSSLLSNVPLQSFSITDINRLGVQSVADAIRRFSGVIVKDYGGIGGFKTVLIRGNGAAHTTVLYDGMSVNNAQSGQVDVGKFSLDNLDMLSLTIGQSDNIFGTAKAVSSVGVLDIKTSIPDFNNKQNQIKAQIKTGSWGLFSPYLFYAHKIDEKFSLSIDGSWERADGRYPFKFKNVSETIDTKRRNSDIDTKRTEFNILGNLTDKQNASLKVYYYDSERGIPGPYILANDDNKERMWDKIFFTQIGYLNKVWNKWNFQVQGKYTHTYNKYADWGNQYPPSGKMQNKYVQNEIYTTMSLLYKPSRNLSASFAEDISYNTLRADKTIVGEPDRYTSLSAFSLKYDSKEITVIGNLLTTWITEKVKSGISPNDVMRLSPSLSVSYKPFGSENLRIRASFKDIIRVPTFDELYFRKIGNTGLKPEKATEYNIGLTWSDKFSDFVTFFSLTTDFYYNKVRDKLIIRPSVNFSSATNFGQVDIKGIDINANTNLSVSDKLNVFISGNYTYQYAVDKTDPLGKSYNNQIPYTPLHSGAASVSFENKWVNLSYSLLASGMTYNDGQNIDRNKINGYIDHSVSVNKSFKIRQSTLRLQADITNITDKTYYIIKNYPMPGRAYRITLNMKF